jgi:hypothetical protein
MAHTKIRPRPVEIPNYDPRMMDYMTYRNNITDPVVQSDPEMAFETERNYLFISSSMRDRSQYPDPSNFKIELSEPLRDIVSIELSSGVLPNKGNIAGDGYLLLDVPELNHIKGADGSKYFGILGLQHHPSPNREYFNLDKSNTNDMPVVFRPIRKRLDSLTLILRHPDGSMVQFGDENAASPADLLLQTQFTFEIRTKVRKRVGLDRDERALPVMTPYYST